MNTNKLKLRLEESLREIGFKMASLTIEEERTRECMLTVSVRDEEGYYGLERVANSYFWEIETLKEKEERIRKILAKL